MNGKKRSDKDLLHLGLPPMELAESNTNVSERSNNTSATITTNCLYPLLPKLTALFIIILMAIGSYLTLATTLKNLDYSHNTEVIVITGTQTSINSTNNEDAIKVVVKLLNKTSHLGAKRQKREALLPLSEKVDTHKDDLIKFNEQQMIKARNIIANYDVKCNVENQNEMCKDLVTKLKAIGETTGRSMSGNKDTKINSNKIAENTVPVTSTEKAKRETNSLFQDVFKTTPNLHFDSRNIESYLPNQQKISLTDACLLARLLRDNYPHLHGEHEHLTPVSGYGHPPHANHPYSGHISPAGLRYQSRDVQPQRHQQDEDIFVKFLESQKRLQPCNDTNQDGCSREANCPDGTFACSNGEGCVSQSQWCDGKVDCTDVSDELSCSCKSRIHKSRICDGYFDCPHGEDEMGCFGCTEFAFSCGDVDLNSQSTCFTKEQRCNNVVDCPNHKDETDCTMLAPSFLKKPLFAISNTEGFLHRNFKGDWYPVCQNPYMWAHESCRRETGLIVRPPFIQLLPIDPMLRVNYINTGPGGWIQMTDTCFNSSAVYVTCPDMLCGTRDLTTVQSLREDEAIESHLFGRNKRFFNNPHPLSFYHDLVRRSASSHNPFDEGTSKSKSVKVKRAESRVVGGRPSQPAAWPWLVAMYRDGMFHCGGVIVTQNWIVSAAHCVYKFWDHYYEIQAGMLRRFSYSPQERNYVVTHIIVNHHYNQEDMRNDMSLLRVKPAIIFSRWVRPVCLPGPETAGSDWKWGPRAGTMCVAVGWGATMEHGPDPDHMREVEVPVWEKCKHKEDRVGNEICAGMVEGGRDACQGDSGGPLLCRNPMNSQQWYMAGIVSHGDGCARKNEPGVYTRVSLFVGWIRFHVYSKNLPEVQPKQTCPGFKCISGILKCIPNKRVCDKVVDCLGAEDELNCETMRSSNDQDKQASQNPSIKINSGADDDLTKNADESFRGDKKRASNDSIDHLVKTVKSTNISTTTESKTIKDNITLTSSSAKTEIILTNVSTTTESITEKTNITINASLPELSTTQFSNNDAVLTTEEMTSSTTPGPSGLFNILDYELNSSSSNQISQNLSEDSESEVKTTSDVSVMREMTSTDTEISNSITTESYLSSSSSEDNSNESGEKTTKSFIVTTEKIKRSDIGDMNTFVVMSSRESLESRSSVKETQETVTLANEGRNDKIPSDISQPKTQNFETATKSEPDKITLLADTNIDQKSITSNKIEFENSNSTTEKITFNKSESNDLTLSPALDSNDVLKDITHHNDSVQKTQDIEDNSDNLDLNHDLPINLQPAKIIKKHHTPKNFECRRINQVIPYKQRCDHKPNCEDGTDELGCTCADYLTTFDEKLLCDGIIDCSDGQDEKDCFSCSEGQFLCRNSQLCLPSTNVCDGKLQCPQGEDELDCFALSNGKNIIFDSDGRPTPNLEGYLTMKQGNDWHIMCEDNLSREDQEENANHICRYLGFSSANRYQVKYINVKEDEILKEAVDDQRHRREIMEAPIHFTYRQVEKDTARNIIIREPQLLKEQCVPNITRTCMSLYVYCDHSLYFDFDTPQVLISSRSSENWDKVWPWAAKVYVEGEYKCTGVLIDLSWVLVNHLCLWNSLLSHHVIVVLGSQRTLSSTTSQYEQSYQVDGKKDLYHSKAALLHLKDPASYSSAVKPMALLSSNIINMKPTVCLALGQDGRNTTVGVFLRETNDDCSLTSRCYERIQSDTICAYPNDLKTSTRQWAGIISCHVESGWYPAATFVDNRGECGFGNRIVASEIENLRHEMKGISASFANMSETSMNDLCEGQRCGRGQCVTLSLVCDGVRNCHDGSDESEEACQKKNRVCSENPYHRGCDCSSDQMKCRNGKCIAKELYMDGRDDCGDKTDEPAHLDCSHYLSRVKPSRQCDGIVHCKDRSDEDPFFCRCFAKQTYKCRGSRDVEYCVPKDMICDGIKDCPEGDDESICIGQSAPSGTKYGTGQVIVRSHGVWHSKCYEKENHTKSELEAICSELGFISGHAKQLTPPENTLHKYNDVILDQFIDVRLNNNTLIQLRNTDEPLARAIVSDTIENCYPIYIECL